MQGVHWGVCDTVDSSLMTEPNRWPVGIVPRIGNTHEIDRVAIWHNETGPRKLEDISLYERSIEIIVDNVFIHDHIGQSWSWNGWHWDNLES